MMRQIKGMTFALMKSFLNFDEGGRLLRYIEAVAYFTDFNTALKEKKKYEDSFVFPLRCHFYKDRRKASSLLRPIFH